MHSGNRFGSNGALPGIDREFIEEHYQSRLRTFHMISDAFLRQAPVALDRIRQGLESGNYALVEERAHTLKGSGTLFGARELIKTSRALEKAARDGDAGEARRLGAAMEGILKETCDSLARLKANLE